MVYVDVQCITFLVANFRQRSDSVLKIDKMKVKNNVVWELAQD